MPTYWFAQQAHYMLTSYQRFVSLLFFVNNALNFFLLMHMLASGKKKQSRISKLEAKEMCFI